MKNEEIINKGKIEPAAYMLSRNPEKAMQEMMDTINKLCLIYTEENEALHKADTKRFVALQDRKISTAREYEAHSHEILRRRDEMKTINPGLRKQLTALHDDFTRLSTINLEALSRVRRSVQKLGDKLVHAARETVRNNAPNYSATGSMNGAERSVSISINESA